MVHATTFKRAREREIEMMMICQAASILNLKSTFSFSRLVYIQKIIIILFFIIGVTLC